MWMQTYKWIYMRIFMYTYLNMCILFVYMKQMKLTTGECYIWLYVVQTLNTLNSYTDMYTPMYIHVHIFMYTYMTRFVLLAFMKFVKLTMCECYTKILLYIYMFVLYTLKSCYLNTYIFMFV